MQSWLTIQTVLCFLCYVYQKWQYSLLSYYKSEKTIGPQKKPWYFHESLEKTSCRRDYWKPQSVSIAEVSFLRGVQFAIRNIEGLFIIFFEELSFGHPRSPHNLIATLLTISMLSICGSEIISRFVLVVEKFLSSN